jgi:hypothetical protein
LNEEEGMDEDHRFEGEGERRKVALPGFSAIEASLRA